MSRTGATNLDLAAWIPDTKGSVDLEMAQGLRACGAYRPTYADRALIAAALLRNSGTDPGDQVGMRDLADMLGVADAYDRLDAARRGEAAA